MKTTPIAGLVLCALMSAAANAASVNYRVTDRIKVPDGGFDYATFDPATGRVLMTRTDFTTVIDAKRERYRSSTALPPAIWRYRCPERL
jgi:hypothetical protein